MKGKRYLAKNIFFLTVGQFGTKFLIFFLVPLYTRVLTSSEYGTFDLYSATVSLLVPVLTLNIADSTTIFLLDKKNKENSSGIISISLGYYFISLLIFSCLLFVNWIFNFFPVFNEYIIFLFLMFALSGLSNLFLCYARGFDRIKNVSVSGVLCSAVMIALNLIFLLPMKLGLKGYYLATIGGYFVQILYLGFSLKIFKEISFKRPVKNLHREMISYSSPMMLNTVSWWINNVSDRYIVTAMCGIIENGIYSVAYKIPSILSMFQSIFSQAWTLSAVQDFDSEDKNGFFSKMYALYNVSMVLICSVLIVFTKVIAKILYANDFYSAWKYVPFLLISVVFGSLSGYLGGIFAAVKDSKSFASSTVCGAVLNIILNFLLIHFWGALGAAVATAVSYVVVWAIRLYRAMGIIKLRTNLLKDIFSYLAITTQAILLLILKSEQITLFINSFILALILAANRKTLKSVIEFIKSKYQRGIK